MNNIVTVRNLEKSYAAKKAVDGISFVVRQGEIVGLLGPNGAGKSTTIHILATILTADQGEVTILGHSLPRDAKQVKQGIGIVPQDLAIYEEMTAWQNVRFFAGLYHLKGKQLENQVKEALELVGLPEGLYDTDSGNRKRERHAGAQGAVYLFAGLDYWIVAAGKHDYAKEDEERNVLAQNLPGTH